MISSTLWSIAVALLVSYELHIIERELVGEKEILIKEIHHRTKNNLSIITSLISLQSQFIENNLAKEVLLVTQNRIQTISKIHELLHVSKTSNKINLKDYLTAIIDNVLESFLVHNVTLKILIDEISTDIKKSITCGIIINELLTNTCKYAFTNNNDRQIQVKLSYNPDIKDCKLFFSDNGSGIPEEILVSKKQTMGLKLIEVLVNQLDGTLDIQNNNGAEFSIHFPL